ncbi:hypothetical protein BCR42DRAFT_41652 [Absidia repens]|uniref:Uncharacterized protein n=1 Tax=Absidia repens TaxID=90262 RepID=A0A1X2IH89_9FUNG|nr:hypothetical protein BCR42DRAFT_41652 [Absidia repens]
MLPIDIILGYLSIPVIVENSVHANSSKFDQPIWSYGNLTVAFFVLNPPSQWTTHSKHDLRLKPTATAEENELFQLLFSSLQCYSPQTPQPPQPKNNGSRHGIIIFDSTSSLYTNTTSTSLKAQKYLGIISCSQQQNELSLQIIQSPLNFDSTHDNNSNSSNTIINQYPLDTETWSTYPLEILRLCQTYSTDPVSQEQLRKLTNTVFDIASLYGYWDLWKVVEGICGRFSIDPRIFLP